MRWIWLVVDISAMAYLDLYSCFAIAVTNISEAFGIAPDDPRGLTLTGGLPFFGGAGNNYSGHAIVEAVQRLRDDTTGYALVGANGGFMSKYSTGIYSRQAADWSTSRFKTLPGREGALEVRDSHSGSAVIDSYTIVPGRKGVVAAIVARTEDGARIVANPAAG